MKHIWGGQLSLWGEGGIQSQQEKKSTKPAIEETLTSYSKPSTTPALT